MGTEFKRDPVTAIAEAEATGETAAIFADIRATMHIPLITSIWRTLFDVEGGLRAAWDATKPLYETGQPATALIRLRETAELPIPSTPFVKDKTFQDDLLSIRAIVDAYNRSNGMNLIALTAMVVPPSGDPPNMSEPAPLPSWPDLPRLLPRDEIPESTWTFLEQINSFGAMPDASGLATLWRHLAHWPDFLKAVRAAFGLLQADGTMQRSMESVFTMAQAEGARLAHLRSEPVVMPDDARQMIEHYVATPARVARMVTLGHGLAAWLRESSPRTT